MNQIRFLPWIVAALVFAILIGVRFMPAASTPGKIPTAIPAVASPRNVSPGTSAQGVPPPSPLDGWNPTLTADQQAELVRAHSVDGSKIATIATAVPEPKWVTAFTDNFETAKCVEKYTVLTFSDPPSDLAWYEKYKALLLRNNADQNGEIYAAIPKSLPGDVRVRFKAMCPKDRTEISIGIMFSIAGSLRQEDGYFAELAYGRVKLKKQNKMIQFGIAPTPQTPERWVNVELRRVGAKISMFMEGSSVLEWADDQPDNGSQHDLMSFYIWNETTIIKDLIIERNANDPTQALSDNPAAQDNAVRGMRAGASSTPQPTGDF